MRSYEYREVLLITLVFSGESPKSDYLSTLNLQPLLGHLAFTAMQQAQAQAMSNVQAMEIDPPKPNPSLLNLQHAMSSHESGSSFDLTASMELAGPSGMDTVGFESKNKTKTLKIMNLKSLGRVRREILQYLWGVGPVKSPIIFSGYCSRQFHDQRNLFLNFFKENCNLP